MARVCDLPPVVPASRGKVEFDDADEGREFEVLEHLLRRAIVETFRSRLAGLDLRPLQDGSTTALTVTTGDTVAGRRTCSTSSGRCPVLSALLDRLEPDGVGEGPAAVGLAAAVLEFALEGLYLNRRLAKDTDGARTVYGARVLTRAPWRRRRLGRMGPSSTSRYGAWRGGPDPLEPPFDIRAGAGRDRRRRAGRACRRGTR